MTIQREIIVTTSHIGWHKWPDAPPEVVFLRNIHRHVFHIKMGIPVLHNDRDHEFFVEQRNLNETLVKLDWASTGSCEMIAEYILSQIPYASWAEVWEDKENGARVSRTADSHN